mgnify:CR=1 FL=1
MPQAYADYRNGDGKVNLVCIVANDGFVCPTCLFKITLHVVKFVNVPKTPKLKAVLLSLLTEY